MAILGCYHKDKMIDCRALLRLNLQAADDMSLLQVFRNNLIDVFPVHVGVPNAFRIDHDHRPLTAAIQATGGIDSRPAFARQTQGLDPLLGISAQFGGPALLATLAAIVPFIGAKKYVVTVIGHKSCK
jgi:hypothetical protein